MITFKEYVNEKKTFFQRIKQKAKRVFSGGEKQFIAPYLKDTKPFKGDEYEEYGLFVDYGEAVIYYDKKEEDYKNIDSMSINKKLLPEAHHMIKKYNYKIKVEEDEKNKFYFFVTGIGKESDIKDFVKEVLDGIDYAAVKWEF